MRQVTLRYGERTACFYTKFEGSNAAGRNKRKQVFTLISNCVADDCTGKPASVAVIRRR
jgi:hypothetical protein